MRTSKIEYKPMGNFNNDHFTSYLYSWFRLMRPMTFSGTISPILAGTALAATNGSIRIDLFLLMLITSLLVQSSANLFNDYFDFLHGQDQERWVAINRTNETGPFHRNIPYVATTMIALAIILGAWISLESNWWVALVGTISILAGLGYSAGSHSFSALGLGETIAAIFLGLITTTLSYMIQGNVIDFSIIAVACTYALLISSMILTNNIRDIKKDAGFRKTIAIRMGRNRSIQTLTSILIINYLFVLILILSNIVPITAIMAWLALPIAFRLRWSLQKDASIEEEKSSMGWASKHHWTFGLLFAFGICIGII